jgi:hypothetical protein
VKIGVLHLQLDGSWRAREFARGILGEKYWRVASDIGLLCVCNFLVYSTRDMMGGSFWCVNPA